MDKIAVFCELLIEANKATNLVSKNDEQKLMARHVADSLMFAKYISVIEDAAWADIGSGAGFPVIPLCMHLPQVKFYAIEPRKKRCEFLNSAKQKLDLRNFEVIQRKAETCGLADMDYVSCRAVGSLQEDFDRAKKILKPGGQFLTVKSKRIIEELRAKSDKLLKKAQIWGYNLPPEEQEYALIIL